MSDTRESFYSRKPAYDKEGSFLGWLWAAYISDGKIAFGISADAQEAERDATEAIHHGEAVHIK